MFGPQCGASNSDTARSCVVCGGALVGDPASHDVAAAWEAVRRLRRYVPPVVAEGVLHDQGRLHGERREVTVLFADAVGFTSLAASLDAETIFELINDLLGRLVECIHRYDGVVDKFTGDGLMAIFGAPIAHENDAERALRAALDMQEAASEFARIARARLGAPLQIRIGLDSGPVVAGIIGADEQVAYTVIGEAVNLAARLEALARPGHILVSPRVYHQMRGLFDFKEMGTAHVKGFDEPLPIYEVVGSRPRPLPTSGITGAPSIFLGREAELEQLRDLMMAFLQDRHGRLVVIQGEAGIGKSRLVSEWLSGVAGQVDIRYGRAWPYARGQGYDVFRAMLQEAIHTQPPGVAWDAEVSVPLRIFLWHLVGILSPEERAPLYHLGPERLKRLTILALREWVLGETRLRPLVLVLEDFHSADDLSRDALQSLIDLIDEAPVSRRCPGRRCWLGRRAYDSI